MSGSELVPLAGGQGLAVSEHSRLTQVGLELSGEITEAEMRTIGAGMNLLVSTTGFAVGDWANFYLEHFPADFQTQLSSMGELDSKTVRVYAAVSRAFPHAFRARYVVAYEGRRALSFSHFSAVRRYGLEQAEYWLERAASEDLSLEQMTALIEAGAPGEDDVPVLPEVPTSEFGKLYWLGPPSDPMRHLLLCGDSTLIPHVASLRYMAPGEDAQASMVWTDPPYGVDYVGKTEDALTIQNDTGAGLEEMLVSAWLAAREVVVESAPFYCAGPSGDRGEVFLRSFRLAGLVFKQYLIWLKNRMVMGRSDHHYKHEPIFYGQFPGRKMGRTVDPRFRWYGGDNATSVFEVDSPAASREHPTMKPVKLIRMAIENSSQPGEIILDLFGGSGSTLIAAEQTGRRAFVVEFDPRYADVIQARYKKYLADQEAAGLASQVIEAEVVVADTGPDAFAE